MIIPQVSLSIARVDVKYKSIDQLALNLTLKLRLYIAANPSVSTRSLFRSPSTPESLGNAKDLNAENHHCSSVGTFFISESETCSESTSCDDVLAPTKVTALARVYPAKPKVMEFWNGRRSKSAASQSQSPLLARVLRKKYSSGLDKIDHNDDY